MAYDCGLSTIIAETEYGAVAAKFHCRKAKCEFCAELRRKQLVARGCTGEPNRMITLTSWHDPDKTPEEAYPDLIKAMQDTIRYARHRLNVSPEVRWKIPGGYKVLENELKAIRYAKQDDAAGLRTIEFFRVAERDESGWPHLHILARCPHIPQEWLSWQLAKRLKSPIVDIRAVRNRERQVRYCVSYATKEEHRFGNNRRYSFSQKYKLPPKVPYVPIVPPGTRIIHHQRSLHQVLYRWYSDHREVWTDNRRWHGWGDLIDAETGEIWDRPPNTTPYDFGVAFDDW